jgi:hypothetical protein
VERDVGIRHWHDVAAEAGDVPMTLFDDIMAADIWIGRGILEAGTDSVDADETGLFGDIHAAARVAVSDVEVLPVVSPDECTDEEVIADEVVGQGAPDALPVRVRQRACLAPKWNADVIQPQRPHRAVAWRSSDRRVAMHCRLREDRAAQRSKGPAFSANVRISGRSYPEYGCRAPPLPERPALSLSRSALLQDVLAARCWEKTSGTSGIPGSCGMGSGPYGIKPALPAPLSRRQFREVRPESTRDGGGHSSAVAD